MTQFSSHDLKKRYLDLLRLSQLYLLQEFRPDEKTQINLEKLPVIPSPVLKPNQELNPLAAVEPLLQLSNKTDSPQRPPLLETQCYPYANITTSPCLSKLESQASDLDIQEVNILPANKQPKLQSQANASSSLGLSEQQVEDRPQISTSLNVHDAKLLHLQKNSKPNTRKILLEPLGHKPFKAHLKYAELLKKHFPFYSLCIQPLNDEQAIQIKNQWSNSPIISPASLLCFSPESLQSGFLKNICLAIRLNFCESSLVSSSSIEKKSSWQEFLSTPHLKLLIGFKSEIFKQKSLSKVYHASQDSNTHFLEKVPLILLEDFEFYVEQANLKKQIWLSITQILQSKI